MIPQITRTGASPSNTVLSYPGQTFFSHGYSSVFRELITRLPTLLNLFGYILYQAYGFKERTKHRVANQTTRRRVKKLTMTQSGTEP